MKRCAASSRTIRRSKCAAALVQREQTQIDRGTPKRCIRLQIRKAP